MIGVILLGIVLYKLNLLHGWILFFYILECLIKFFDIVEKESKK